jgi:glycosyltransferase involved in cell wall biosynthesis
MTSGGVCGSRLIDRGGAFRHRAGARSRNGASAAAIVTVRETNEMTEATGLPPLPKVTILMPVHNGERYLDAAIASVVGQDFADFELVIVDDGSTDATSRILQRWAARDARIIVLREPENAGVGRAFNRGLAVARGQYVAKQDADDICARGRLVRQVGVLDREPDVVLVSADYSQIDADGAWAGTEVCSNPSPVVAYLLHFSNAVGGGGGQAMFRRDMVMELGGFRDDYLLSHDYELWARLSRRGRIVILPMVGMKRRLHDRQLSVTFEELQRSNSLATSRRMLTELLGRAITDEEEDAVAAVWRAEGRPGFAAGAERMLREAYARFVADGASGRDRRRARLETGMRWFRAALVLARTGDVAEAARHLVFGLRWHPLVLAVGARFVISRMSVRLYRRVRRRRRRRQTSHGLRRPGVGARDGRGAPAPQSTARR